MRGFVHQGYPRTENLRILPIPGEEQEKSMLRKERNALPQKALSPWSPLLAQFPINDSQICL